jgi:uncharacterized membrane protein
MSRLDEQRLDAILSELEQQGVLTSEQRARVGERIRPELPRHRDKLALFVRIVAMLGGLLVAAGILLFIAANWEQLGKGFKLVLIFGTLLAVHHAGFVLAEEPGRSPATGRALTLVGVLLFGGALGLVAQIYHITPEYPWSILLWWTLSVPFALLTRSRSVFAVVLLLFLLWLGWHAGFWLDRQGGTGDDFGALFCLLALSAAALFRGLLVQLGARAVELGTPLRLLGPPLALAGLYALSIRDVLLDEDAPGAVAATFLHPAATGALAALLLVPGLPRAAGREDALVGLATLAAALLLGACVWTSPAHVYLLANAVLFVGLLLLIATGVRGNVPSSINFGIAGFLGLVLTRYFEYVGSRIDPFWAFIAAGLILLGLGRWLETQRRTFLAKAGGGSAP